MFRQYLLKLMSHQSLDIEEIEEAITAIIEGQEEELQIAAFLALLRAKPETVNEILGIINVMKKNMLRLVMPERVLDIVGTGGDGANTINISTAASILAASCGVKVAKHGSRSASSQCGSADVLEALHINIQLPIQKIAQGIKDIGIGFFFAPLFHPGLQQSKLIRKRLNIPSTFNLLGPLLNPTTPAHFILGVYDEKILPTIAEVLSILGTQHSVVIHGAGIDEFSTLGPTLVYEINLNRIKQFTFHPEDYGFKTCSLKDLQGGRVEENARLLLKTLQGAEGPIADALIINAAWAIYLYGLVPSIQESIKIAENNLKNGMALQVLEKWKNLQ